MKAFLNDQKKWHNKYGARVIDPGPYSYVTKNRTHEKRENAANDKESDSIGEAP